MKRASTIHAFFETAAREPERVALKRRLPDGRWASMTRAEYAREVRRVARALIALGVRPGERIALCGPNRPEWLLTDLGALAAGAVPAPYYPTLPPEQAGYVVEHSEAVLAVVQDAKQVAKLDAVHASLGRLRARVVMEGSAPEALRWAEFLAKGDEVPDSAVEERLAGLASGSLATLIYT
ncbi:MAG TPA: AMP-binding protein, partial [Myxococcales bacterium]|nr:AMP-binding protein [Myxococcales bacterium]